MDNKVVEDYLEKIDILKDFSVDYLSNRNEAYQDASKKAEKFGKPLQGVIDNAVQDIDKLEKEAKEKGFTAKADPNVVTKIFNNHFQKYMKDEYENSHNSVQEQYLDKGIDKQEAKKLTDKDFEPVFERFQEYIKNTDKGTQKLSDVDKSELQTQSQSTQVGLPKTNEKESQSKWEQTKEEANYQRKPSLEDAELDSDRPRRVDLDVEPSDINASEAIHATKILYSRIYGELERNPNNPNFSKAFEKTVDEYKDNPVFTKSMDSFEDELNKLAQPTTIKKSSMPIDWETEDVFFKIGYEPREELGPINIEGIDEALTKRLLNQYALNHPIEERAQFKENNRSEVKEEVIGIKENGFINKTGSQLTADNINDRNEGLDKELKNNQELRKAGKEDIPVSMENLTKQDVELTKGMSEELIKNKKNYEKFVKATYQKGFEAKDAFKGLKLDSYVKEYLNGIDQVDQRINKNIKENGKDSVLEKLQSDMNKQGTFKAFENMNTTIEPLKETNIAKYEEYKSYQNDLETSVSKGYGKIAEDSINKETDRQVGDTQGKGKKEALSSVEFTELIRETIVEMANRKKNDKTPDDVLHQALQKNKNLDPKVSEFIDELRDEYAKRSLTDTKRFVKVEEEIYTKHLKNEYKSSLPSDSLESEVDFDKRINQEVKDIVANKKTPIMTKEAAGEAKEKREMIDKVKEDSLRQTIKNIVKSVATYYSRGQGQELEDKVGIDKEKGSEQGISSSLKDRVKKHFPQRDLPENGHGMGSEDNVKHLDRDSSISKQQDNSRSIAIQK